MMVQITCSKVIFCGCDEGGLRLRRTWLPNNLSTMAAKPAFDYRRLPIPERLQLVEEIWDSIAQDATVETLPLSDEEKVMLDQRLAELDANPDAGRPWLEVRASIIERFRKRPK